MMTIYIVFLALLICPASCLWSAECPSGEPGAETLFETEGIFVEKLEDSLVIFLDNIDGGGKARFILNREQASGLLSYAVEARNVAPGMNPFAPTGNMEVPKQQKPLEPLLLETVEGMTLWAHVAGRDYRSGAFFADFLLAPADSDKSPDSKYMQAMMIYGTSPTLPKEEKPTDEKTGLPAGKPEQPTSEEGESFLKFLNALESFTGSRLVIIG